jgi:PKD repeat protein
MSRGRSYLLALVGAVAALSLSGCAEIFCGARTLEDRAAIQELVGTDLDCTGAESVIGKRPLAIIDVTPTGTIPYGGRAHLDGSASESSLGPIERYSWDLDGDGRFGDASRAKVDHAFRAPGIRTVRLIVTDSEGNRDRATAYVEVGARGENVAPVPNLVWTPPAPYTGDAIRFDASDSYDPDGTIEKYEWHFGDNELDGFERDTGGTPTTERVYHSAGTHTVWVRVTDNDGKSSIGGYRFAVQARDNTDASRLDISPNPARLGETVSFTFYPHVSGDYEYEWDLDGNGSFEHNTGTSQATTHRYEQWPPDGFIDVRVRSTPRPNAPGDPWAAQHRLTFQEGPPRESARVVAARRPALRFKGRLEGAVYRDHRGRLRRSRRGLSVTDLVTAGTLQGRLIGRARANDPVGLLLHSVWRSRLNLRVRPHRLRVRGLAYVTFERAPATACVRLRLDARGRRRSGTLAVLSGTGDAARLATRARFRFRFDRRGRIVLRGTIRPSAAGPRPMSRACRDLRTLRR